MNAHVPDCMMPVKGINSVQSGPVLVLGTGWICIWLAYVSKLFVATLPACCLLQVEHKPALHLEPHAGFIPLF